MTQSLKPSAQTFQATLKELGYSNQVIELPESTRTAKEAADAIGCKVEHIAKSIIFRLKKSDEPILVIASGTNRINEATIETEIDDTLGKANAKFVKEKTGYTIGGVPPFGHRTSIVTLLDEDLFQYDTIWAAAGHAMAVFETTPQELAEISGAKIVKVK